MPTLVWHDVLGWWWIWWHLTAFLGLYGLKMIFRPTRKMVKAAFYPNRPFWRALGWTLFANGKFWLGTFAIYLTWKSSGVTSTPLQFMAIGGAAWLEALAN